MYYLRMYELYQISKGHVFAVQNLDYLVGPGFLNAVNRYYDYQVWI